MYSAYLFFVGTNTFIIPKALAGTAVNGVTISLEGTDTGRFNSSTAVKGVYGIK